MRRISIRQLSWLILSAAAVLLSACSSPPPDTPAQEDVSREVWVRSLTDDGLFQMGVHQAGIFFDDYKGSSTAVLPGTGADGLNLLIPNGQLTVYRGQMYYFDSDPYGQTTLFTLDMRAQNRRPLAFWHAESGDPLLLYSSLYARGYAYVVFCRRYLMPAPEQSTDRICLQRIRLDSGAAETVFETEALHAVFAHMLGVDESGLYFLLRTQSADDTVESSLYHCRHTDGAVRLAETFHGDHQFYESLDGYVGDSLYDLQVRRGIQAYDLKTGTSKMLLENQRVHTIYSKVDSVLYCLTESETAEFDLLSLDLETGKTILTTSPEVVPILRKGEHLYAFDTVHQMTCLLSKADFDAGRYDNRHVLEIR